MNCYVKKEIVSCMPKCLYNINKHSEWFMGFATVALLIK